MKNFSSGVNYLKEGYKLIFQPGLRRFVVLPLLINICLFMGMFFLLRYFVDQFDTWFTSYLPGWLQWLSAILWIFFFLAFIVMIVFTFVTFANIVSAPFNSFLAENVELFLTGKTPEPRTLMQNMMDIPRIIARQLSIIGYYVPRALLILVLFFIPVVQAIAAFISFMFHAWIMTLTYIDYPTDNHRVAMKDVRSWLRQRRLTALGFGLSVLICSMIPGINFFTIPAAVAGATKFWLEESKM